MSNVFTRLKGAASNALGLDELPYGNKRFLMTQFNFVLFTTIPGVFINTFFLRQNGSFATVAIYNAIVLFGSALVMQVSAYVCIKKTPVFVLRTGVFLFNIFYISLLVLQHRAVQYMPLIASLGAIASGFYYQGSNVILRTFTHDGNFNKTLSIMGLSFSAVSLAVPTFSGLIISRLGGGVGYMAVFLIAFAFSIYTTWLSSKIPPITLDAKPDIVHTYKKIFTTKSWLLIFVADIFRGMRDTSFVLLLNLIFFKYNESEALLGVYSMFCGIASVISFYIVSRVVHPENRMKFILTAASVLTVSFLSLFFGMNGWVIFILSVINSFFLAFIQNPSMGFLFGMLENVKGKTNFSQVIAAHEIFWGGGRVLGFITIILFSGSAGMYKYGFLILNLSAFAAVGLLSLAVRSRRPEDDEEEPEA